MLFLPFLKRFKTTASNPSYSKCHWYIDFIGDLGVENWMYPLQSSSRRHLQTWTAVFRACPENCAWSLITDCYKTCLICISMGTRAGRKAHMHLLHASSVCTGAALKYLSFWLSVPGWICIKMQSQREKTSSHLKMQAKLYNESPAEKQSQPYNLKYIHKQLFP